VNSTFPVAVSGLSGAVTMLVAGTQHTCVLTSASAMQCWGYNSFGQLGNGGNVNSTVPVSVTGLSGSATTLAAGAQHTCALTSVGVVQCWGYNVNGQLGNGNNTNSVTPVTVAGLIGNATALAAGAQHSCALNSAGAVQCWGYNLYGQLGNGSTTISNSPVTVNSLSGPATALAAGFGHVCALINTGAAQCWGYNLYGQLGNGGTANSGVAVTVTGLSGQ
jgi:alpha-tubulin suppressor-like RCC1 family protein